MATSQYLRAAGLDALEDGCDSPSLRVLSGLVEADLADARTLFKLALAELGVPTPSKRDALLRLSQESAREILRGRVDPYEGAKRIWRLSVHVPEQKLLELDPFIYAASEWEDRPEDRHVFEEGIVLAAKTLLGEGE